MPTLSLHQIVLEKLRNKGDLKEIEHEVDPNLEIAQIHLDEYAKTGKALLFHKVKGTKYACSSNLFGTLDRSTFIFDKTLSKMQGLVQLKTNPEQAIKKPWSIFTLLPSLWHALPKKESFPANDFEQVQISDLPLIKHWPMDGGAFVTLPQVYTEDPDQPGVMNGNLGMYRVQLNGNQYIKDKEIGLHYQLHRGIGVHQTKWNEQGKPMKVSVFVGGHPAHSFAAVMPLPEGLSELSFAGVLAGRRFRYSIVDGYVISNDADFVITGEVYPHEVKPEGPFGDHFGYYSLQHDFPVMRIHKVWARKNGIWPFTVVGRPPQEDTQFGALVHLVAGSALSKEIPGLCEVNAVDAAGVHPLLLAIGQERYTPYQTLKQPQELLTIGNHILGKGQLSLAKFLWIVNQKDNPHVSTHHIADFFTHLLERVNWTRDIHFYTKTTIDTLDYSGSGLNTGSKVLIAAIGDAQRVLGSTIDAYLQDIPKARVVMKGVLAISMDAFSTYEDENNRIELFAKSLEKCKDKGFYEQFPLIIVCDDARFVAEGLDNWLWVTFTRSNPAMDMYGVESFTENKHWGCKGPLIIDARLKPHMAPVLTR